MSQFDTDADTLEVSPADDPAQEQEGGAALFSDEMLPSAVEAVLLTSEKALSPARVAQALGLDQGGAARVGSIVDELNASYEREGRAFRVERVAGGLRLMTLPEYATAIAAMRGLRDKGRLSKAAIETLSIVAYRQPVTRAAVESIRGVACGEVLRTLLERGLVQIVGRAEELGRPMLYGTSKRFLDAFGLASITELPPVEDGAGAGDWMQAPEGEASAADEATD